VIVVLGSLNVDLVARVARLPKAGETLSARGFDMVPGGKGANQALAARRAGAAVRLFGHIGDDALAAVALSLLADAGVDVSGVAVARAPTGVALIEVDGQGENTIVVAAGANAATRADQVSDALLVPGTTVVLQLEIPLAEVAALAQRAAARHARVVLNAAPAASLPERLFADVDVLVVNETEADALAREHGAQGVADLCAAFARAERTLVVTRGAEGVSYTAQGETFTRKAPVVEAIDTVGAGDAFTGALAAALDRGADLDRAISEALAAGALACTRPGAQSGLPSREEIRTLADTL
jgi:ribokinase